MLKSKYKKIRCIIHDKQSSMRKETKLPCSHHPCKINAYWQRKVIKKAIGLVKKFELV